MSVKGRKTKRTSTYGTWAWNDQLLQSKVGATINEIGCKQWLGSIGPHTGLFGAVRNGKPQMTQARRVLLMSMGLPNMEESAVRMRCNNEFCVNTDHMFLEGNRRVLDSIDEHVDPGFTETRIGYQKWHELNEEQKTAIKNLAALCEAKVHFDHEFMYYSITWTTYGWFKARLKDPATTELLTVVYRKKHV